MSKEHLDDIKYVHKNLMEGLKLPPIKMSKEEIKQLAEEISFRLLATRKHPEHEWLIKRLGEVINKIQNNDE